MGDAPSGQPVDLPSLLWGPRAVSPCVDFDFDFWSTPRDGTLGKIKNPFQNFLLRILLSNLRNLGLPLLLLNLQSNRLVGNALSVWVIVTLLQIVLLKGICLCIMAL